MKEIFAALGAAVVVGTVGNILFHLRGDDSALALLCLFSGIIGIIFYMNAFVKNKIPDKDSWPSPVHANKQFYINSFDLAV